MVGQGNVSMSSWFLHLFGDTEIGQINVLSFRQFEPVTCGERDDRLRGVRVSVTYRNSIVSVHHDEDASISSDRHLRCLKRDGRSTGKSERL